MCWENGIARLQAFGHEKLLVSYIRQAGMDSGCFGGCESIEVECRIANEPHVTLIGGQPHRQGAWSMTRCGIDAQVSIRRERYTGPEPCFNSIGWKAALQ